MNAQDDKTERFLRKLTIIINQKEREKARYKYSDADQGNHIGDHLQTELCQLHSVRDLFMRVFGIRDIPAVSEAEIEEERRVEVLAACLMGFVASGMKAGSVPALSNFLTPGLQPGQRTPRKQRSAKDKDHASPGR